jgi:undecaprenyl-diphosphatase
MFEMIIAVILGCVEGLTEFLPVSSTGHLILTGSLLHFTGERAKTFEIVIQLGSILAVVVLYWKRLWSLFLVAPGKLNILHIICAMIPAVILGLLLHDGIKAYLFSPKTVAIGLVIGGILMIYAEKKHTQVGTINLDELTYRQAICVGLFQCFALWPGFSRSGATIAGGILLGVNHKTAAEFSFLVAVPMMIAASGLDLVKSYQVLSIDDLGFFLIGFFTAFVVALAAIVFFLKLLAKVKLTPFAYYRFVLAGAVWIYFF